MSLCLHWVAQILHCDLHPTFSALPWAGIQLRSPMSFLLLRCAASHLCPQPWLEMCLLSVLWAGCTCIPMDISWQWWECNRLGHLQHRPAGTFWENWSRKKRVNKENTHPETNVVWRARLTYVKELTKVIEARAKQDVLMWCTDPLIRLKCCLCNVLSPIGSVRSVNLSCLHGKFVGQY